MEFGLGNKQAHIKAIGIMSGTSLDGLDIAAVNFKLKNGKWSFEIIEAETISYPSDWRKKLQYAPSLSGEELSEFHTNYGRYIGSITTEFIDNTGFIPELIASHGHTVFHQPEKGFTLQIGNGAEIAATTGIQTITDFRVTDVALGGQGAPLVPIGDQLLFSEYEYCLNLGGFANISFEKNDQRIAFDICPVNVVLNHFAEREGLTYDKNGELGKQGDIHSELLKELNGLMFYTQSPPKSLGREWIEKDFFNVPNCFSISDEDKLRTIYEHIAIQISKITSERGQLFVTGGGTFNSFLMERIKECSTLDIVIPKAEIINFKEALIFAFLGVLRIQNKINCLSSVTGASKDSSCGILYSA